MSRQAIYERLEPDATDTSLDTGFRAILRDPVWMLAKQWLMGEHQSENASSPVYVAYKIYESPLAKFKGEDPKTIPIEPVLEMEPSSWWTMGRRIRLGKTVAAAANLENHTNLPSGLRFTDPPPPYDHFHDHFDGRALWFKRNQIPLAETLFNPRPPDEPADSWQTEQLVYQAEVDSEIGKLSLPRHWGGQVDWYSAEGNGAAPLPINGSESRFAVPSQFRYPGAPADRWWTIENAAVDIGGYPPDPSRFPTTLLIDLISSHSVDWFQFPVATYVGHVATLTDVQVTDSFDETFTLTPPSHWSLFRTTRFDERSLVVWPTAIAPLQGPPIEEVMFGIDEYSNCLWAVERRIRGREVATPPQADVTRNPDTTQAPTWHYRPATAQTRGWHPYLAVDQSVNGNTQQVFVQAKVVPAVLTALGGQAPQASVLGLNEDGSRFTHRIIPVTIPSNGIVIERNYALARDTAGKPRLWIQRQRKPLLAPPSHQLRFDAVVE